MRVGKRSERLLSGDARAETEGAWYVSLLGGLHLRLGQSNAACGIDLTDGMRWETMPLRARHHVNTCLLCRRSRLALSFSVPPDLPEPGWYQHPAVSTKHYFRGLVSSCGTVAFHASQGWRSVPQPTGNYDAYCVRCSTAASITETNRLLAVDRPPATEMKPELQRAHEDGIRFHNYITETITSRPVLDTLVSARAIESRGTKMLDSYYRGLVPSPEPSTYKTDAQKKIQILLYQSNYVNAVVYRMLCRFLANYVSVPAEALRSLQTDAGTRIDNTRAVVGLAYDDDRADRLLLLRMREQLAYTLESEPSDSAEIMFTITLRALQGPHSIPYA